MDDTYDADLLGKLIPLCLSAEVPVPDWMDEIAKSGGGGGEDGSAGGEDGGEEEDEW